MDTFSFLSDLQHDVGARRAGTAGEQRAIGWLEARCRALGWHPERQPFRYIGAEAYRHVMMLLLLAAGVASAWLPRWAGLALVALVISFVFGWRKRLELRLAGAPGENLLAGLHRPFSAYVADPQRSPAVIFCAHYDTARCMPRWLHRLRGLMRFAMPLGLLAFLLYAVLELLHLGSQLLGQMLPQLDPVTTALDRAARWGGWVALALITPLFVLIVLYTASSLLGRRQDSPGADDNGSGVAVLLALGQHLAESPPPGVELLLAFWGAEEKGLFGSRQFVREFSAAFPPDRTVIVNVDCVGVGEYLSIYAGQGVLRRRATDPQQMTQLEAIAQEQGVPTIRTWESIVSGGSSDHAEWVERGYTLTTSLIREDHRRPSLPARLLGALLRIPYVTQLELKHIHSPEDTLAQIIPERLEATTAIAEEFGRRMAASLNAPRSET